MTNTNLTVQDLLACTRDTEFTPESIWDAYCEACELSNGERRTKETYSGRCNGIADLITCAAETLASSRYDEEEGLGQYLDDQLFYTWDLAHLAMEGLVNGTFEGGCFTIDYENDGCDALIDVIGQVAGLLVKKEGN